MQALKIRYKNAVEYEIVDDPAKEAYFVFGVRKSGSSILNSIMHALADFNGIRYVDVAGLLFEKGLRVPQWQADAELANIIRRGNLYGGLPAEPAAVDHAGAHQGALRPGHLLVDLPAFLPGPRSGLPQGAGAAA